MGRGYAAIALEELNHFPVNPAVSFRHGISARVHAGIWIGATLEQHLGHFVLAGAGAVPERHAPAKHHIITPELDHADALIGIESEIQQQRENLRPIMTHRDSQQTAGILDRIRQRTFSVTGAQPFCVSERGYSEYSHWRAMRSQELRQRAKFLCVAFARAVRGCIQRSEVVPTAWGRIGAMIEQPSNNLDSQLASAGMQWSPALRAAR